jgi:membrane fusion protein, multidrug efflux system
VVVGGLLVFALFPLPADKPDGEQQAGDRSADETRRGPLRRHPIAVVIGVIFLSVATSTGTTLSISSPPMMPSSRREPKVSGYITAVPVTDSQHVVAGDVIAWIDDRNYRIALELVTCSIWQCDTVQKAINPFLLLDFQ